MGALLFVVAAAVVLGIAVELAVSPAPAPGLGPYHTYTAKGRVRELR